MTFTIATYNIVPPSGLQYQPLKMEFILRVFQFAYMSIALAWVSTHVTKERHYM